MTEKDTPKRDRRAESNKGAGSWTPLEGELARNLEAEAPASAADASPDAYLFTALTGAAGFDLPLPDTEAGAGSAFLGSAAPIKNSMKSRRSRAL